MHEIPNLPFPSLHQPETSESKVSAVSQQQAMSAETRAEPKPAKRKD
jgi:hypothetical protein